MENIEVQKKPKGRKVLKFFTWFFIIVLLIVGAVWAYFNFTEAGKRDPFSVIPDDAIYIIETSNLTKGWLTLSDSKMWKHLMENKKFEDINKSAMSLDSLIRGNETLDMLFSDRKLLISAHMISFDDYDFIFAVDLKKASKIMFLKDYIGGIVTTFGFSLSKRKYSGSEIMLLTDNETQEVLNIAFIDNIMVCSYTPLLVEKSIRQKDTKFWTEHKQFKLVSDEISNGELFNFYINYSLLDDYMKCYLSESSEIMKSLSRSLSFSAFNVDVQDERLSLDGYIGINDSFPSYVNALMGVTPGGLKAHTIISDKAALYLSIGFKDFNEFFNNLKNQFDAEDTTRAMNYDMTIKKVEKYLKVNLQTDFFGWIGNEITFVKLEPTANAREEDVVVTIHSKDIEAAKTGLDHLTSQVKKKTIGLAKFNEEDYKGYPIKYLGFSGLLKLFFGKLFSKIEKPYFTYINDFVVFSNSPSCLMDVIDDYTANKTLAQNETFMNFVNDFKNEANVSVYVQMPKIYSHMYYYSKSEKREGIRNNKDVILAFTRIGFQMISEKKKFKTTLIADFDEDAAFNNELEKIEAAAEELFVSQIDTGIYRVKLDALQLKTDGPKRIKYADSLHVKFEGRVVGGQPDGMWRIYYNSGKIAGSVNYSNGKASGNALFYYDNDKQTTLSEVTFVDDMIDGVYREFYENGQRKATVNYSEGVPDGDAEFFYDSGMIKMEGQYKNGDKTGKWKHYTELGELIDKEKWKKGIKKNRDKNEK